MISAAARTYHEPCCWSELDYEGVEASAHEPVRKLGATEGELVSSRESLLAIGGMRAETRLRQGVYRVSKLRLRRVSSSCPSKGAWDKGAVRRNLITTRCESERS